MPNQVAGAPGRVAQVLLFGSGGVDDMQCVAWSSEADLASKDITSVTDMARNILPPPFAGRQRMGHHCNDPLSGNARPTC